MQFYISKSKSLYSLNCVHSVLDLLLDSGELGVERVDGGDGEGDRHADEPEYVEGLLHHL